MKKLTVLFTLLLCLFINEMSAQKIYYSLVAAVPTTLEVYINGNPTAVIDVTSTSNPNGNFDITQYLTHTSSPWDIITIHASTNNLSNPITLFAGEYGLPTYSIEDEPTYSANSESTYVSFSCTWAIDANDMYIEVNNKI